MFVVFVSFVIPFCLICIGWKFLILVHGSDIVQMVHWPPLTSQGHVWEFWILTLGSWTSIAIILLFSRNFWVAKLGIQDDLWSQQAMKMVVIWGNQPENDLPILHLRMFVSWNVDPDSNKISKARLSVLRIDGLKHLLSLSLGFRDDPIFVWPYIPNSTDIDLRWMQLHKGANFRTDATCEANEFWSLVWFQRLTLWGELPKKHDGNMAKQQNVSVIRPYMNAFGWHGSSRPSKVQGNLRPIWPVVGFSADPSTWPYIIWTYVITQGNSEMDCTPPGMYKTLYNSGIYLPSSTGFLAGMFWTIQPVCQPRQILRLTCDVWRYDQLQETLRTWLKSEDRKKKKNTWRWILDGGTTFPSPPVVPVKGTNVVDSRVFVQILQA